ncbi:MAG: hypothetical protein WB780_17060 [Candidatus Acidiferrales bacterium]
MRPGSRLRLPVLLVVLGVALPTLAYEYPLSSTSIRDAYFFGKRHTSVTTAAFKQYTHYLPPTESAARVQSIGLETPFVQVAERSGSAFNYYAQDAEEEFTDEELPFRVLVTVDLSGAYTQSKSSRPNFLGYPLPDFCRAFEVQLVQDKPIPEESRRVYLLYSDASTSVTGFGGVTGAVLELDYDAEAVDSTDTTIKVVTPDGQQVETTFDLTQLR